MLISLLTIPQWVPEIRRPRRLPPCHKTASYPAVSPGGCGADATRSGTRLRRVALATPWHVRCEFLTGRIAERRQGGSSQGQCREGIQPQPGKQPTQRRKTHEQAPDADCCCHHLFVCCPHPSRSGHGQRTQLSE